MLFGYAGDFGPIYYISSYAIDTQVMSARLAFDFLPILNAVSIPGRIITGFLANTMGPVNILVPTALTTGIIALCLIGIHRTGGHVVYAILYDFFSGGFVSLSSVALTSLTPDHSRLGARMGMCFLLCSLGILCGTPISGARDGGLGRGGIVFRDDTLG